MSLGTFVYLSVCLSVCLSMHLSVCLSFHLSVYLSDRLSAVRPTECSSVPSSVSLSVDLLLTCLSVFPRVRSSLRRCVRLFVSLYFRLYVYYNANKSASFKAILIKLITCSPLLHSESDLTNISLIFFMFQYIATKLTTSANIYVNMSVTLHHNRIV